MWRALAVLMMLAGAAQAGDSARLNPLGFTPDGAVFAFEQFGVQDGSGFPYAEIFAVDMMRDQWLPPSPFRVRLDTEQADVTAARAQAFALARPLLQRLRLGGNMQVLAHNPESEVVADRRHMRFDTSPWAGSEDGHYDVALEDITFPGRPDCPTEDGKLHGFRLTLSEARTGKVLAAHADASVPASRGCTLGYELEMVVRPDQGEARYAVLVAVKTVGFEGPDRRFVAVPLTISGGAN